MQLPAHQRHFDETTSRADLMNAEGIIVFQSTGHAEVEYRQRGAAVEKELAR